LSSETTFFDHYRLRNLGGQVERVDLSKSQKNPVSVSGSLRALPLTPVAGKMEPIVLPAPKTMEEKNQINKPTEPRWLHSVKWLTRLFFSLVFLIWVFILGFLFGRGTLSENIPILGETFASLSGQNASQTNSQAASQISSQISDDASTDQQAASAASSSGYSNLPTDEDFEDQSFTYPLVIAVPQDAGDAADVSVVSGGAIQDAASDGNDLKNASANASANANAGSGAASDASRQASDQQSRTLDRGSLAAQTTSDRLENENLASGAENNVSPANSVAADASTSLASAQTPTTTRSENEIYWPAKPEKTGDFTVQVAFATSEKEAVKYAEFFLQKGFDAYYYQTKSKNYPVRVGRYETQEQAKSALERLKTAGAVQPYISKLQ
jgi:hypothetical protein